MCKTIEKLILLCILALFAIYGVNWGAPKVGEVLSERLNAAARVP